MLRLAITLSVALLAAGCVKRASDNQARYYEDGSAKPLVSLVPVIDRAMHDLEWSVSEELTSTIHYRLLQKNRLYLVDHEKVASAVRKLDASHNPFGANLAWVKRAFPEDEFVIFMELVEHEEIPASQKGGTASELNMAMRVRVVDLRHDFPKVILQEMVRGSHSIPKQFSREYFFQVPWGKESYSISPIGLAHSDLSQEVARRVEDYILLAMKR